MPTAAGRPGKRRRRRGSTPAATPRERELARRRAGLALARLAPLLEALADAADLVPLQAARLVRTAIAATLGWRARLVPSPSPLATEEHARVEGGVALIPIAPGAGALRLAGQPEAALRQVAELCAHALARSRSHPREPARGPRRRALLRVLVTAGVAPGATALASLLGAGFEAVTVEGPEAAVEAGRGEALDAILLDLAADHAGLAVLEALRADAAGAGLPAVVIGARVDEATRLRALALGADFLSPPLSAAELRARLEHAVGQARSTRALRDEALTDPLTGLPNRRALESRLHEEFRRARRYHTPLACIMADLDHLKPLNDALGHVVGDQALQAFAAVLKAELRATDFGARAGGDEFLLLLPHTAAVEAAALAERIRRRLAAVRVGRGPGARALGASFGVAELEAEGDGQAMVDAADRALYVAKREGRGLVRLAPGAGVAPLAARTRAARTTGAARPARA